MHKCACVCVEVGWRRRIRAVVFLWLRLRLSLWVRPFQLTNTTTVNSCTVAGLCSSFFVFLFIFFFCVETAAGIKTTIKKTRRRWFKFNWGLSINCLCILLISYSLFSCNLFSQNMERFLARDCYSTVFIFLFSFFALTHCQTKDKLETSSLSSQLSLSHWMPRYRRNISVK